jgi:hypothetical protein
MAPSTATHAWILPDLVLITPCHPAAGCLYGMYFMAEKCRKIFARELGFRFRSSVGFCYSVTGATFA